MFYFDVYFDQRFARKRVPGALMLLSLGAPEPTVFQRTSRVRGMTFTHSVAAFYAPPEIARTQP